MRATEGRAATSDFASLSENEARKLGKIIAEEIALKESCEYCSAPRGEEHELGCPHRPGTKKILPMDEAELAELPF
jgi:hypothetical protein